MKRAPALGVILPVLALGFLTCAASSVSAQDPKGGGAAGPRSEGGSGARSGGSAAPAPTASSSSGGGSTMSGNGSTSSSGSSWGGDSSRPVNAANPRGPRANGAGSSYAGAAREARPASAGGWRGPIDEQASGRARPGTGEPLSGTAVPWYTRPRGGSASTGTVVNRDDVPVTNPPGGGGSRPIYPGYPGYGYPGYGYPSYGWGYWGGYNNCYWGYGYNCFGSPWGYGGFGLGYFYYNPSWWPYDSSYGYGGYGYGDYGSMGGFGGGGYSQSRLGGVRLKVQPNTASVYVDGYYAGRVDDFDNTFQKLGLTLGVHRLEISAPGYLPLVVELNVRDWDTMKYQGRLEPIR